MQFKGNRVSNNYYYRHKHVTSYNPKSVRYCHAPTACVPSRVAVTQSSTPQTPQMGYLLTEVTSYCREDTRLREPQHPALANPLKPATRDAAHRRVTVLSSDAPSGKESSEIRASVKRYTYTRTILGTRATSGYNISYKRVHRAVPHRPPRPGIFYTGYRVPGIVFHRGHEVVMCVRCDAVLLLLMRTWPCARCACVACLPYSTI